MQRRVITTIPASDQAFRRAVDRLAQEIRSGAAEQLAAQLRPLYPRVAVFERQLSGEAARFYAYRDGRYRSSGTDAWWDAEDVACICVSAATGRIASASGPWDRLLMGAEPGDLVGRHFTDFVQPDARMAAAGMFEAVVQEREVRSQALVIRPDGRALLIEFRAMRRNGEIEIHYRSIDGETPEPGA